MLKQDRKISKLKLFLSILCLLLINIGQAFSATNTKPTPEQIYNAAKIRAGKTLQDYKEFINITNEDGQTALCLAQQNQDKYSYEMLLVFGADREVECHDDNDPICAIVVGEKLKLSPAGAWILAGTAAAGAIAGIAAGTDLYNHHEPCPKGYSKLYKTVADCGKTGAEGWIWEDGGIHHRDQCGKCTPKTYDTGCSILYQSVADCGEHAGEGWEWNASEYSGDVWCGICTPKKCPITESQKTRGSSTFYFTSGHCPTVKFLKATEPTHAGWYGEEECFTCHYQCDEENGFASETTCKTNAEGGNGYTCQLDPTSGCYYRSHTQNPANPDGGRNDCPNKESNTTRGASTHYHTPEHCPLIKFMEPTTPTHDGWSGEEKCFTCHYQCDEENGFASETTCKTNAEGGNGYTCQLDPTSGCYYRSHTQNPDNPDGGRNDCPIDNSTNRVGSKVEYANQNACPNKKFMIITGTELKGYSGEDGCHTCLYQCDEENGYASETTCRTNDEGKIGYNCQRDPNSGCYYRSHTQNPDNPDGGENECPEKSTNTLKGSSTFYSIPYHCPIVKFMKPTISGTNIWSGEKECFDCIYQCDEKTGFASKTTCTTNQSGGEGYICYQDPTSQCYYRSGTSNPDNPTNPDKPCPTDYDVNYQSIKDCLTLGGTTESWSYDQNGWSGELKCGKCNANVCPDNSSKDYTSIEECPPVTNSSAKDRELVGYSGAVPCYRCLYTCNNSDGAYDTESQCKAANPSYKCQRRDDNGCWYRGEATPCPEEGTSTSYTSVNACGSSGGTCAQKSYGWTWTRGTIESGGVLCNRCEAKTCGATYSTAVQLVSGCGVQGATGWKLTIESGNCAGDTACTRCDKKSCTSSASTDSNITACATTEYADVSRDTNGEYAGDDACYVCNYTCKSGTYNSKAECENNYIGYYCTQDAISGCWHKSDNVIPCPLPSSTQYKTIEDCPKSEYAAAIKVTIVARSGDEDCYECAYECSNGYTSFSTISNCRTHDGGQWDCSCQNIDNGAGTCCTFSETPCPDNEDTNANNDCENVEHAKLPKKEATNNMSGNAQCYKCVYECEFATEDACEEGHGYECDSVETPDHKQCWYQTKTERACPSDYEPEAKCKTVQCAICKEEKHPTATSGDKPCVKLVYTCDTSNEGCSTDNTSTDCHITTAAGLSGDLPGYDYKQVTEVSGECYIKTKKVCPENTKTNLPDGEACRIDQNAGIATSWEPIQFGCSGDEICSRCSALNLCDKTDPPSSSDCSGEEIPNYFNGGRPCKICLEGETALTKPMPMVSNMLDIANNQTLIVNHTEGDYLGAANINANATAPVTDELTGETRGGDAIGSLTVYNRASNANVSLQAGASRKTYNAKADGTDAESIVSAQGNLKLIMQEGAENVTAAGITTDNTAYNAYAAGNAKATGVIEIDDTKESSNIISGISSKGSAYNAFANQETAQAAGTIDIKTMTNKKAYGIFASADIYNQTAANQSSVVNVKGVGSGDIYGLYSEHGNVYNSGEVNVYSGSGNAYGIYLEDGTGNQIDNSGQIYVTSDEKSAYGIYVKDAGAENGVTITNTGLINATGDDLSRGIKIEQNGQNATVVNKGSIIVNGALNAKDTAIDLGGAVFRNAGDTTFTTAQNLNALNGKVTLEQGGTYQAEALSGDLLVGTSVVKEGFKDTYIEEGAIKAEDIKDLNLSSESALFTANLRQNANKDAHDAELTRRNFNEFAPNSSIGNYLEKNYEQEKLAELFEKLKSANAEAILAADILKQTGADILPNIAQENLMALRNTAEVISDSVLDDKDEANRVISGADGYFQEADSKNGVTGYDNTTATAYMFGDKRIDNKNRLGVGVSFMQMSSSYDNGGDRKESFVSIFFPWLHKFTEKLKLASILNFGYGWGKFDRGIGKEADLTDYIYGLSNKLVYSMNLADVAELEPALMFNVQGYTSDDINMGDLIVKKGSHLSAEAGIGLFIKKSFTSEKYGKLTARLGGAYYHEFADPDRRLRAGFADGNGTFDINDYADIYSRDRAVLSAMLDYEYKRIALYLKYNRIIQRKDSQNFDMGVKYNF